ncbi:MAG: YqeG family HAD IIIA-type phosphatase [Thermogutta sp.]
MVSSEKESMAVLVKPDYYFSSVTNIDLPFLRREDIRCLLLDVDCTIADYRRGELEKNVAEWLKRLQAAGIQTCLVSNGGMRRIKRLAGHLRMPFVARSMKPFPWGCRRAIKILGVSADKAAMVGDQLFADVLAGRWAGLKTILVQPRTHVKEPWITRWKRPVERWLLERWGLIPIGDGTGSAG